MIESKKQSSPILVIVCALGVLAFLILVIYPNHTSLRTMDETIAQLKDEIAMRTNLAPVFQQLIEKTRLAPSQELALPDRKLLTEEDVARLSTLFQTIAEGVGVRLESVVPDAEGFEADRQRLLVDLVFYGDFETIQPLLNTILARAFVDRVHTMDIRSVQRTKRIRLTVALFHD